ncbi:MAG: TonB-dependent receptor, partial [Rhodanobacteraceae bacterium]
NADSTFGVDVAAAHYGEQINRQGREIFSYSKVSSFAGNPNVAAEIANGTVKPTDLMPAEINVANFQQTRKRNSAQVNLQYKPTNNLEFGLSGLYVKEGYNNFNQSMYAFTSSTGASSITSLTGNGQGFITGGHSCGVDTPSCVASPVNTELDNGVRFSTVTTTDVHLDGSYNADNWGVKAQVGEGRARDDGREYDLSALYFGGYSWTTAQGAVYDSPQAVSNPANWSMNSLSNIVSHTPRRNKVRYGTLDFHVDFDSFMQQLLFGIQYENNTHSLNSSAFTAIRPGTYADVGPVSYTDILNNSSFPGFSRDQGQHVQVPASAVESWVLGSPFDYSSPNAGSVIRGTWSIAQKTEAAYAQLDFGSGPVRGDVGVRFVKDRLESTYYNPGTFAPVLPPPPGWLQTSHSTFDNVLPSFNLVYDNGGNVLYRLAAAKVIAWAPYPNFLGSTSLNGVTLLGNAGNPDLKPYKSYNYSASVEWYFAPQSVLSFTAFYDHITNYISNVVVPDRQFNGLFQTAPALYNSAYLGKMGNCDAKGFCDFSVAQPTSIGGGAIKGFSVAYQQPFGHTGFGLLANYTYALGTTHIGYALPYNSKNSVSLSPYFEKGPFNARLTYNFRSKYLAGGYSASAEPATVSNYTELDFTAGWAFNDHWSLQLSALNLLNEAYDLYEVTKLEPVDKYTNGRRYMATLHFKWAPPPAAPEAEPVALPPPPPPAAAPSPPPQHVVIDLRGVNFKFDRPKKGETNIGPSLKPPASESLAILNQAVDTLNRYPQVQVEIDGYSDSVGNPKYNQSLSERRAQIVDQYLTSHGVAPSRITAVKGFGDADPVDTNKTAAGRQRNRRVEFKVEQSGVDQSQGGGM